MLPVETIDHIFSLIDPDTLANCILAHPFLADIAARYLYSDIFVNSKLNLSPERASFHGPSTFFDNPSHKHARLAQNVRSLRILLDIHEPTSCTPSAVLKSFTEYWENILSTLQNSNLETLKLTVSAYDMSNDHIPAWQLVPESFRVAFVDLLHSSSKLKEVFLYAESFPLSFLTGCSLKYLSLTGDYDRDPTGQQYSHLHTLSLSLFSRDSCSKFIMPLLEACSDNLTDLELDLERHFNAEYHVKTRTHIDSDIPINLSILPRLENLTIHGHTSLPEDPNDMYWTPLPAISRLLELALPLKRLTLRPRFFIGSDLSEMDWNPVARFIPQHATHHPVNLHVTLVDIVRCVDGPSSKAFNPLQDNVQLNCLVKQGLLTIKPIGNVFIKRTARHTSSARTNLSAGRAFGPQDLGFEGLW